MTGTADEIACIGAALRRTANLVTRVYNAHLAPAGLEVTQYSILRKIQAGRAGSASELAEIVGVERSTLVRNLARLEKLGLIEVRTGAGRRQVHALTEAGEARLAAAAPLWHEAQTALVERMSMARTTAMLEELTALRRAARSGTASG